MSDWQASIFTHAGGGEARLWSLKLHCGADYPRVPPSISFTSRITMDGVDARGNVRGERGGAGLLDGACPVFGCGS